ncbi:MAG: hypothetical protein ACREBJ_12530, partial [Nitrosotalea sp.]
STPFSFQVQNLTGSMEEPLNKQESLVFDALLRRVNKSFASVSNQKNPFQVRYPIHLTPMQGRVAITIEESSSLTLMVQSITSVSMGINGTQKRRIYAVFEISDQGDAKTSDVLLVKTDAVDEQGSNKVKMEIDLLSPQSQKTLGVNVRFTNPNLRLYSKVKVVASLYLDYFAPEGQVASTRCIQQRFLDIQLCEKYHYHPLADLLLVTHAGVSIDGIQEWKDQLQALKIVASIWNSSYYDSIDFAKPIENSPETLEKHFPHKTVVILNHVFRGPQQNETVVGKLPYNELFRIARLFDIKTYVVGSKITRSDQYYPAPQLISEGTKKTFTDWFIRTSRMPKVFDSEVKDLALALRKDNPLKKHIIFQSY